MQNNSAYYRECFSILGVLLKVEIVYTETNCLLANGNPTLGSP